MPIISNFPGGSGSGGGGLALASATNIKTVTAHEKVYIQWTDPEDLVVAGSTLASWGGTLLVRKAGSMPTSRRDGVIVLDSKTRDAYKSTYFCDSGLTDGTVYYYKLFPYTTANSYTDAEDDGFSATPNPVAVGNVTGMSAAAAGNGKLNVKWTDPASTVVTDGITVATWANTTIVVKAGSYATSPDDAGAAFSLVVATRNQYANNALNITGLTNGTTYYISFFPISTDGAVNTNTANRTTGVPNRLTISTIPSQSNTLTYNKAAQNPTWSGYDSTKMKISGETVGTNAKTYTATFTPEDDYVWAGDTEPKAKNVTWTIGKATGSLTLSPASITLDKSTTSATFTISGDFDGSYSVVSQNTGIATVALVSGKTYRVSSVNSTTGSTTVTVTCSGGSNYTVPSAKSVSVTAKFVTIYGVSWDGTSTTKWSRTDASASFTDPVPAVSNGNGSSPFDNLAPWNGMTKSTDSAAGVVVAIPKFYYKWTKSGNTLKLQIADGQTDGFNVSPAHANRGDGKGERDVVYVGRYHCASGYKSTTGAAQQVNITRSAARTGIHNLGATIWQFDYAMRVTIQMLYLVEFADWNSQAKIGYGCSTSGSKLNNGQTDAMTYHTGTTAANRTTYGFTQYRNIEGLWDNVYDWMDGCYYNGNGMNIIFNPNNFSDSSGGTLIGKPSSGWPSAIAVSTVSGLEWAIYPTAASGSESTYVADSWSYNASNPCLCCGGNYFQNQYRGLFYVSYGSASYTGTGVGCRLQKLP